MRMFDLNSRRRACQLLLLRLLSQDGRKLRAAGRHRCWYVHLPSPNHRGEEEAEAAGHMLLAGWGPLDVTLLKLGAARHKV